jgi:hypothetical protein
MAVLLSPITIVVGASVNEGNWPNEALVVVDSGNVTGAVDGLSYGFVLKLGGRLVKMAWSGSKSADAVLVDKS